MNEGKIIPYTAVTPFLRTTPATEELNVSRLKIFIHDSINMRLSPGLGIDPLGLTMNVLEDVVVSDDGLRSLQEWARDGGWSLTVETASLPEIVGYQPLQNYSAVVSMRIMGADDGYEPTPNDFDRFVSKQLGVEPEPAKVGFSDNGEQIETSTPKTGDQLIDDFIGMIESSDPNAAFPACQIVENVPKLPYEPSMYYREGEEPDHHDVLRFMKDHAYHPDFYYAAREHLRELAYGGKPPSGYQSWGDYHKYGY